MNIKTLITFVFVVLTAVFMTACRGSENGGDKEKVKTEIPAELSDNQKVKEYFETLDLVIDEYVTMIEEIAITSQDAEKNGEEPSYTDAMKMMTDVTSSTMKMAPLIERMEKLEKEAEIMKEDMTPAEVEAFSKTYAKMMMRYYDMSKKLEENQ
jgi:hypothetical protein